MKVKTIVTSVAIASLAMAGSVYAAGNSDAQMAALQKQVQQLQAQVNAMGNSDSHGSTGKMLSTNSDYTFDMINNQTDTVNKELTILKHVQNGSLSGNGITVGVKGDLSAQYQRVSSNNKTRLNAPIGNLVATGVAGDWVAGFVNLRLANQSNAFIGSGFGVNAPVNNISGFSSVYLQDAYVVVGNLKKSPFYGFAGRKNVDFGNFNDVSNMVPSMTQSFFMAQADQVGVGYHSDLNKKTTLTTTFTAMNGGGSGSFNTVTPNGNINDFAANAKVDMQLSKDMAVHLGGGYINGTGFISSGNTTASKTGVGAVDLNAGMVMGNEVQNLAVNGEFVVTTHGVRGLQLRNNFSGNLNNVYSLSTILGWTTSGTGIFTSGSSIKAFNFNTAYTMPIKGHSTVFFANYDNVIQNSTNRLYMLNLGGRTEIVNNVWAGGSYVLAGGKMAASGATIPTSSTVLADVTAYF
ncbi:hypothetical protein N8865_02355 [Francisellaceae bacterium]|nr:hypothetical protein [Francisellaceae bacterium]